MLTVNRSVLAQSTAGPNSASTATNTSFTGSVGSWSNPGNALNSDNSYASITLSSNGDYSDYLEFTDFGFSLSGTDIILGIEVEIERFGSNIKDNQISIIKEGSIGATDQSLTSSWSGSDPNTYESYGGSTDLWGETWTASDINASDFGVAISVRKQGGGRSRTANIDHVRITIHYDVPLPVGLVHFSAETEEREVNLNWTTSWEEGNSHFEVQRATNNLQFVTLDYVAGANNSSSIINYQYRDEPSTAGRLFYRLIQHDFNGDNSISEIVAVDFEEAPRLVSIRPSLVQEGTFLSINDAIIEDYQLVFFDPSGKQLPPIFPKNQVTRIDAGYFSKSGIFPYQVFHKGRKVLSGKVINP